MLKTDPIKSNMQYTSVNIIGAGCIGHLLAFKFQEISASTSVESKTSSSLKVFLHTKTPRKDARLEYKSSTEKLKHTFKYSTLDKWQPADLIIIAVKGPGLKSLCNRLSKLSSSNRVSRSTPILIMMNGMGLMETVSAQLPNNPIFQATTTHGVKFEGDSLLHTGYGETHIGSLDNDNCTEHIKPICEFLEKHLPLVYQSENLTQTLWKKLLINAVINPLSVIYNIDNGQITSNLAIKQECYQLCHELAPFIQKLHIFDNSETLFEQVCLIVKQTKSNVSSMRQDHLKHQLSEIDSITGYLLSSAKKWHIELPLHRKIYRKIKRLENHF